MKYDTMRGYKYLLAFSILVAACSSKMNGKIEYRGDNDVYLVNTSSSKIFRFTVKTTKVTNDTIYDYSTESIPLAPGDEELLGVKYDTAEATFPMIEVTRLNIYIRVPDSLKHIESNNVFFNHGGFPITLDTVINGVNVLVLYYKDPLQIIEVEAVRDTTVGNFTGKYKVVTSIEKSSVPNPPDRLKYIYTVTGQVEIPPKDWDK